MSNILDPKKVKKMGEYNPSLKIYCRLTSLDGPSDFNYVEQKDEKTIILAPLDSAPKSKKGKSTCYSFHHVFSEEITQKEIFDHVAFPLVHDLLQGKSGLIFTHGMTCSGKTYTMSGTPDDEGLIPRSLDVIFNSIEDRQASKFVFKPNKCNGYLVQSVADAMMDQQQTLGLFSKTSTPKRSESSIGEWSDRVSDSYSVDSIAAQQKYSVFISYIEIYNNYIYDLLDDVATDRKHKNRSSKMLQEDSAQEMFVVGAEQVEVKSADDALDLFCKGRERRKFSKTDLNRESSRSHAVFTIRVVQGPATPRNSEIEQDQDNIFASQLSFVDLASCERRLEPQNDSRKSYGTGTKNATLVALNSCIEALKKRQNSKDPEVIPYRSSKLTHLFKTFFEGKGEIRMIFCINPRLDDCTETAKFMKFAKTTETLTVPKTLARKSSPQNKQQYRKASKKAEQQETRIPEDLVHEAHPDLPQLVTTFDDEQSNTILIEILERRKLKRLFLKKELKRRHDEFRKHLVAIENENIHLKETQTLLEMDLHAREKQLHESEDKLASAEQMIEILKKNVTKVQDEFQEIRVELHSKNKIISDQAKEIQCAKTRMKEKIACEKHRLKQTMEQRLAAKQTEIERKICFNAERFRQLREILNNDDSVKMDDFNLDVELSTTETSTSVTEGSEAKHGSDKCWSSSEKSVARKKRKSPNKRLVHDVCKTKEHVCKTKESSQPDQPLKKNSHDLHLDNEIDSVESLQSISTEVKSKQTSSRTSLKKLSTFLTKRRSSEKVVARPVSINTNASSTSFRQAVYQHLLRGSCSMFLRARRSSISNLSLSCLGKSKSDDVWIEHRPMGNLELNDFVPPILKKTTVSSLKQKHLTKSEASHYVLQHQEMTNEGEMIVALYKGDINPSSGGGVQVVFKDTVQMLKNLPQSHTRRSNNEGVPLREVAERCTIAIECRGMSSKYTRKK